MPSGNDDVQGKADKEKVVLVISDTGAVKDGFGGNSQEDADSVDEILAEAEEQIGDFKRLPGE